MPNEIKIFEYFIKKWGIVLLLCLLALFVLIGMNSCSGSRHMTKTSSSIDYVASEYSKVKSDSTVTQVKESAVETNINKGISSQDNYTETTVIEYENNPETKQPEIKKVTKQRIGKLSTNDTTKTTKKEQTKNTISAHINKVEKKGSQREVKKATSDKKVDSKYGISFGKLALGAGIFIAFCAFIFFVWKRFKNKIV